MRASYRWALCVLALCGPLARAGRGEGGPCASPSAHLPLCARAPLWVEHSPSFASRFLQPSLSISLQAFAHAHNPTHTLLVHNDGRTLSRSAATVAKHRIDCPPLPHLGKPPTTPAARHKPPIARALYGRSHLPPPTQPSIANSPSTLCCQQQSPTPLSHRPPFVKRAAPEPTRGHCSPSRTTSTRPPRRA